MKSLEGLEECFFFTLGCWLAECIAKSVEVEGFKQLTSRIPMSADLEASIHSCFPISPS